VAFDAEVGVIGVGTMGAQTLWQLAKRGIRAMGIERFNPGHDRSGAGGESRLFRTAYLEGSHYVPLLRRSRALWEELERDSGVNLLTMNGGLMIGSEKSPFLQAVRRSIEEHDIKHEMLDADAMRARYPQHRLFDGEMAYIDRESGFLRPEVAVAMAADRAEALGATVVRHTRVHQIRMEDAAVEVDTGERTYRFPRVVVAAGVWTSKLLPGITPLNEVIRIVMTWFPTKQPAQFAPNVFPIFIRQTAGYDISGWPSLDGATVKVGLNNGWDRVVDADQLNHHVPDELFREVREAVAMQLPGVLPEIVRYGVYMDAYTADHGGFVGPLSWDRRLTVLGGFSGHGFKMSPGIGAAAADYALTGATDEPVAFLSPDRFRVNVTVADRVWAGQKVAW
jgi:sarcosine oxidase